MAKPVTVTDHAILRYIERVAEVNTDELRRIIRDTVSEAARSGATRVTINGVTYCIKQAKSGPVVATILRSDNGVSLARAISGNKPKPTSINPRKDKPMSQNEQILADLKAGKRITPMDALNDYGCFRLSGRIYDLRQEGHNIIAETKASESGARFAEYRLA